MVTANASNSTDAFGNFNIPVTFTTDGAKTIEVYATDDAGSMGNPIIIHLTVSAPTITTGQPPVTPTLQLAPAPLAASQVLHPDIPTSPSPSSSA